MANVTPWLLFQSAQDAGPAGFGQPLPLQDEGGGPGPTDPDAPLIQPGFGEGSPWSNPSGALGIGGTDAWSGPIGFILFTNQTNLLRIAQPQVAGHLPLEFRLLGVELEIYGRWTGASDGTRTVTVQAVVGASVRASLGSCSLPLSGSSSGMCMKGGPTDRMNFSPADVALAGFGFQLYGSSSTFNTQGNTLRIDSLRVRFHWGEVITPFRIRSRRRAAFTRGVLA